MSPALPGVIAPALSVVAPCYDEERSLPAFVERMIAACDGLGVVYEIVLVNDGSRDRTWGGGGPPRPSPRRRRPAPAR